MTINGKVQNESATYYDHTSLTLDEWREALANSEVNNYTFVNDTTAVYMIENLDSVAFVKQYDPVSRTVSTIEVRA